VQTVPSDKWQTKAGGFNTLYAFDPKSEKVSRLADCPTAMCRAGLSHDTKRDLFFAWNVNFGGELGVATPLNEAITALVKGVERSWA